MRIFIAVNNQMTGPFSLDAIRADLASGRRSLSDLAWFYEAPGLVPLSEVPGIKPPPVIAPDSPHWNRSVATPGRQTSAAPAVGCLPALGAFILTMLVRGVVLSLLSGRGLAGFVVYIAISFSACVWVLLEAREMGVERGQLRGFADASALMWFWGCVVLWEVFLPLYLVAGPLYHRLHNEPDSETEKTPDQFTLGLIILLGLIVHITTTLCLQFIFAIIREYGFFGGFFGVFGLEVERHLAALWFAPPW